LQQAFRGKKKTTQTTAKGRVTIRWRTNMMARYSSRAETLFGISSSPVQHSVSFNSSASDDENEFKEEDVWDTDHDSCSRAVWSLEEPERSTHQLESSLQYAGSYGGVAAGGGGGGVHQHHHIKSSTDSSESFRFFNNGRRWLGLEKDPGLSLGLSSLSSAREAVPTTTPGRAIAAASRMMMPPAPAAGHGYHQQLRDHHTSYGYQSAPVNVPDWTKILGSEKKSQVPAWADEWDAAGLDDDGAAAGRGEEKLPPHELLAREYANSQATTFSVFEGAGRTLKGRDLSRVRNAVLRQTGFIDL
jgi:hypothetical protein